MWDDWCPVVTHDYDSAIRRPIHQSKLFDVTHDLKSIRYNFQYYIRIFCSHVWWCTLVFLIKKVESFTEQSYIDVDRIWRNRWPPDNLDFFTCSILIDDLTLLELKEATFSMLEIYRVNHNNKKKKCFRLALIPKKYSLRPKISVLYLPKYEYIYIWKTSRYIHIWTNQRQLFWDGGSICFHYLFHVAYNDFDIWKAETCSSSRDCKGYRMK